MKNMSTVIYLSVTLDMEAYYQLSVLPGISESIAKKNLENEFWIKTHEKVC